MMRVTPCMGVWIETSSHLARIQAMCVTPCMGVWIETLLTRGHNSPRSHTLYGCVD